MKVLAGGKPWRRKPSEAPAVSAASTPAALRSSESAITARATPEISADAGGQPVDAVDQVDHVDHRDDADHRADVAEVDRAAAGQAEQLDRAGVELAEEGEGEAVDRDPGGDRDRSPRRSARAASARRPARRRRRASRPAEISHGAGQDRPRLGVPGQPDQRRDERPRRGSPARPASASAPRAENAVLGDVDRADPARQAVVSGTRSSVSDPREEEGEERFDRGRHGSRLVRVPVEPEREGDQAPELAAEVLAARAVAVEQRGDRRPGRASPGAPASPAESTSRAKPCSGPRSQAATGIEKPCLGPRRICLRQQRRQRPPQQPLLGQRRAPSAASPGRARSRRPRLSRKGTRSSSEWAMLERSVLTSRSSTR